MAEGLKKLVPSDESYFAGLDVVIINPSETTPQTVWEMLQTKRQEYGVDLREAAEYLNIRYVYLLAIDEGRVDDLPGAAYAMGFVRAYADYLGLDGTAIVERYKDETAGVGNNVRLDFPSPLPEGKLPSVAIIFAGLLVLVLVYGSWVVLAQHFTKVAELVPDLPEGFSALLDSGESAGSLPESNPVTSQAATQVPVRAAAAEPKAAVLKTTGAEPQISEAAPVATQVSNSPNDETIDPKNTGLAVVYPTKTNEKLEHKQEQQPNVATVESFAMPSGLAAVVTETSSAQTLKNAEARVVVGAVMNSGAVTPGGPTPSDIAPPQVARANWHQQTLTPATVVLATPGVQADMVKKSKVNQTSEKTSPLPPKPPARTSAEPRQFGSENKDSRVLIKARIDNWVQIQDRDGEKLLTRVLRAGDSYRVPNRLGLLMETGNAGGLEITVDSKTIPDIGPKGAVRRGIVLDADSLKMGGPR